MYKKLTEKERLDRLARENAALKARLAKREADLDYIAMMVDLTDDDEEVTPLVD